MNLFCRLCSLLPVLVLTACGEPESGGQSSPAAESSTSSEPAVASASPQEQPQNCTLVLGWDPWEPYQYEITGGQVFGLDVDLVSAITRHAGCELEFHKASWRDLLELLRQGEVDLLAGATITPERQGFARFTQPYREEAFHLFVAESRAPEVEEKTLGELLDEGWQVGVVEDYLYGDPVTSLQDDPSHSDQFTYATMSETNLARLFNLDVDAVVEDRYVGAAVIRHKNLQSDIVAVPDPLATSPVRIMVSRASVDEDLFERVDESVGILRDNGALEKILNQYRVPQPENP